MDSSHGHRGSSARRGSWCLGHLVTGGGTTGQKMDLSVSSDTGSH